MPSLSSANTSARDSLSFADLSSDGQVRLLDLTHNRLVYSVTIVPFVGMPFVYWKYQLDQDVWGLLVWTLSYFAAFTGARLQYGQYRADRDSRHAGDVLVKWMPIVLRMALMHGLGLLALVIVIADRVPLEYAMTLYMSLAVIMAANATHQSPVFSAFKRFFNTCWGGCTIVSPWVFPDHWYLVAPLCVSYILSIHRHSAIAHRFFVQQVKLEENSKHLAKDYRLAKEEAEAALYAKNRFLTTAAHDLRQPVHAMGFLIESVSRRNQDPELRPALQDLRQSVQSVTQMFNSLLDLSKIELGAQPVKLQPVAIDPLMTDIATLFREEAQSRAIDLRVRTSGGRALVNADPLLLRQSMINLMQNALRYTQRGGVLMAVRRRAGQWQFEVWDTGVGIAQADQQRVYSPFFRPEHAWRIDNAGHGLGLAVVARCADLMGASQGLNSREGLGSRFWLRLPAADAGERLDEIADATAAKTANEFRLYGCCLVVDDEPQVRSAWQALLDAWGVNAVCVGTASEAMQALDSGFEPHAIFCDQRLRSGESGFELLQALLECCPDAVGAMISGEFDSQALAQAEQEGYLVLHKPLDPETLFGLLSCLLPNSPDIAGYVGAEDA